MGGRNFLSSNSEADVTHKQQEAILAQLNRQGRDHRGGSHRGPIKNERKQWSSAKTKGRSPPVRGWESFAPGLFPRILLQ